MIGIMPGKFLPPHRGHLMSIIKASCQVEKLFVVVSDSRVFTAETCDKHGLRYMPLKLRAKWLSQELQNIENIEVLLLDETDIPMFPHGWKEWSELLTGLIPEIHPDNIKFQNEGAIIFGGEESYTEKHNEYFPDIEYRLIDYKRTRYPISATEIREKPLENWDYILGSARNHFAKRILITGTESCGKTTMTKMLAKIYYTSWAEEHGRFYSALNLGGNEEVFEPEDFFNIAYEQNKLDNQALRTANKVVFFDTDAVVTQFYCEMYLGKRNQWVDKYVDPQKYDLILFLTPDTKWVDDGLRWNDDDNVRRFLHDKLFKMYLEYGFAENKFLFIEGGRYLDRLNQAIRIVDSFLKE